MAFDKEILRGIHMNFGARKRANEELAEIRRGQVYKAIPRIREIDEMLRTTPAEIVRAAFSKREDPIPELTKVKEKNLKLQAERRECLVSHGYPVDFLDVHYDCEKCEDTGYVNPGTPCECLVSAYRKEQVKRLSRDFGFELKSFDAINLDFYSKETMGVTSPYENNKLTVNVCKHFAEDFVDKKGNIFISGVSGIGKTLLASCVAHDVAMQGLTVSYGRAFEILGAFEEKKFGRDMFYDKTEEYRNADLLIIDDLGAEMITAYGTAVLYNLMAARTAAGKGTAILSTLSCTEISTKYSPQIASRIAGEYEHISLLGQDIRKKLGK